MPNDNEEIVELKFDPSRNKVSKIIGKLKEKIIGQDRAITEIDYGLQRAFAKIGNPNRPLAILLFPGPSGTGKTETPIALAEVLKEFRVEELKAKIREEILKEIQIVTADTDRTLKEFLDVTQYDKGRLERGEISRAHFEDTQKAVEYRTKQVKKDLEKRIKFLEEKLEKIEKNLNQLPSIVIVDCSNLSEPHTVSSLNSSPPGYVGSEDYGILNPFEINDNPYLVLLLDEFEKAHPAIERALLGPFNTGILRFNAPVRIRNPRTRETIDEVTFIDFRQAIVIMTANIGDEEMEERATGKGKIGFCANTEKTKKIIDDLSDDAYHICKNACQKRFSRPFLNRVDRIVVFRYLKPEHKRQILDLRLNDFQNRLNDKNKGYVIKYKNGAKNFLLKKTDNFVEQMHGLTHVIERELISSLATYENQNDLQPGDIIEVEADLENDKLKFIRKRGRKRNVPII